MSKKRMLKRSFEPQRNYVAGKQKVELDERVDIWEQRKPGANEVYVTREREIIV